MTVPSTDNFHSDEATSDPDEEPADTNQTLYDFEDLLLCAALRLRGC